MRGPLALVINDGATERHVTARTRGLRFRRTAYGGDADMSASLRVARGTFQDLGPGDSLDIHDVRTTDRVFSADIDNPGGTKGTAGESYELQGFGAAARLQAHASAQAYVLTGEGGFRFQESGGPRGVHTDVRENGNGEPRYLTWANEGKNVSTNWRGDWVNWQLQRIGRQLGRVDFTIDAGLVNAGYQWQLWAGTDLDNLSRVDTSPVFTSWSTLSSGYTDGGEIRPFADTVMLRIIRTGGARTATDDDWFRFANPIVRQRLKNPDGTHVQTGYGTDRNYVHAHEVIADMIGDGMAPGIAPSRVSISDFGKFHRIDALAWLDGVTMSEALDQLRIFHVDMWWRAEGNAFTCDVWDEANPRYVLTEQHGGITLPGESVTLCNRVLVSWKDKRGKDRTTVVTANVPGLNYTRDAEPITLPEGLGSEGNANRAGDRALVLTNRPPRAGTAVLRTPIWDDFLGCAVWPHEVLPGYTLLERRTGDVFRLTEVEYVDDDCAATLTLGRPRATLEEYTAQLARRQRRRR